PDLSTTSWSAPWSNTPVEPTGGRSEAPGRAGLRAVAPAGPWRHRDLRPGAPGSAAGESRRSDGRGPHRRMAPAEHPPFPFVGRGPPPPRAGPDPLGELVPDGPATRGRGARRGARAEPGLPRSRPATARGDRSRRPVPGF